MLPITTQQNSNVCLHQFIDARFTVSAVITKIQTLQIQDVTL